MSEVIPEFISFQEYIMSMLMWLLDSYSLVLVVIGGSLARTFGCRTESGTDLDTALKSMMGFKNYFIDKTLDFIHHYWIGALIVYVTNPYGAVPGFIWYPNDLICYLALGMFLEDGFYHLYDFLKSIRTSTREDQPFN